jgi:hypothetical protein
MAKKRSQINVCSISGDDIIEFDRSKPEEVETARQQFETLIEAGNEAFVGTQNPVKVTTFDEVLAQPATTRITVKPKSTGGSIPGPRAKNTLVAA